MSVLSEQKTQAGSTVSTGVSGLDEVLFGGLLEGQFYLVEGEPGTGKTTLSLQFLLKGAQRGEPVLYISLAESEREIQQVARSHGWSLEGLSIYKYTPPQQCLSPEEQYSVFHPTDVEFYDTTQSILKEVERVRPVRAVIDALSEIRLLAGDALRYRRQILALKRYFANRNCTVLLVDDRTSETHDFQLDSIAHGIVTLKNVPREFGKTRRRMQISKMRGATYIEGYHDYTIKRGGVVIYPRLVAAPRRTAVPAGAAASGIAQLDALWGGGLDRGTASLFIGPAGAGKSSIALAYVVAAARRGEVAAVYLFEELVSSISKRGAAIGIDPQALADTGKILMRKIDPAEISPAEFVEEVRQAVEKGAKLIVIDSLNGLAQAMPNEESLNTQFHEMLAFLNQRGIVTILVLAQAGILGMGSVSPVELSYLADNILLFRFFEVHGHIRKALSVVKKRSGAHEDTIRELNLSGGISVGEPLASFRGVLSPVPLYTGDAEAVQEENAGRK